MPAAVTSVIGATGAQGLTGATGIQGATGIGYLLTSGSSNTIGTGVKTFTVSLDSTASMYRAGNFVTVANSGANFMFGQITSYSGTTLSVNVTFTVGSGTYTAWSFGLSSSPGATGPTGATGIGSIGATGAQGATGPAGSVSDDVAILWALGLG